MTTLLDETEVRVLGALIEKQVTTPEYYPLTLNALTAACNQKNNRHPVVAYDEATVERAVESLRQKNLAYLFYGAGSRVPKYKHVAAENLSLSPSELALVCVLMLRGPQTLGELRDRAGRLYEFSGLEEAEATLSALASRDGEPLVVKLPRQPGQKEARYAHLLSGEVVEQPTAEREAPTPRASSTRADGERVARLEQEVESLRAELDALRREFAEFRKQFD